MSLQVWLPLNGNLNNQGPSAVTSTGGTVNNTGILGKCYACTSSSYITIQNPVTDKYDFSFSFWMKVPATLSSTGAWNTMFSFRALNTNDSSAENSIGINWASYNNIKIYDDANHQDIWMAPGNQFNYDKWCHYTITHTGNDSSTTIKVYTDGILRGTFNNSHRLVLRSGNILLGSGINPSYGPIYFNDFRLYDHCLSAKEVKEISKGLVCHYKLDNNGFGNPNLITTMTPGGRTALNGKYGLNADFSQNLDTYGYFNVSPALELNSAYTLSFDVSNFPVGGFWNFSLWNNSNYYIGDITKDGHYTYTFVPSESKLPSGYSLTKFLFDDAVRTNPVGIVHFTNFKIEKGDKATSWCPHTSDSLYTSLGLDSTAELDYSGYLRNADKVNSPASLPGSPRYEVGCKFTGSEYLTFPNPLTSSSTEFSISCWVKFDNASDTMTICTMRSSIGSGIALFKIGSNFRFDDNAQTTFSDYSIPVNTWLHLVVTRSSSSKNLYINGNLVQSTATVGDMGGLYTTGSIGASSASGGNLGNFTKGAFSDFRIYSTALSASDVKELYSTSASIDKSGNMYAYEFKEE